MLFRSPVGFGKQVDAADELPGGEKFANIDEFKRLILQNPDLFAHGLAAKLLTYATGHPLEIADQTTVDGIVTDLRDKHVYGFRSLIHAVVQSSAFRNK